MRKNQKNDSNYESNSRRNNQASQRMYSGRDRDFEQSDRPRFEAPQGRGRMESHGLSSEYTRNSRDYSGNFPSSELSGSGRSWSSEDTYSQGLHTGKGPKGYRRSEERIREDICDALEAHAHIDASDIEVKVSEGLVTLSGTVDSRQAKRLAEQAVETVRGIKDINNELRIMSTHENVREAKSFSPAKTKSGKKSSSNYKQ